MQYTTNSGQQIRNLGQVEHPIHSHRRKASSPVAHDTRLLLGQPTLAHIVLERVGCEQASAGQPMFNFRGTRAEVGQFFSVCRWFDR